MKKIMLNTTVLTLTLGLMSSCAGPESYQQKMARYTPKEGAKNQVPDIKMSEFNFVVTENAKSKRAPASASKEIDVVEKEQKEPNPTNKKLYFLTLYGQYQTLQSYSVDFKGPAVSICPNFHTSLLRHNESSGAISTEHKNKKFNYESAKLADEKYVSARPELLLPMSKDEVTPKVIDVIRSSGIEGNEFAINELVHKAIDIHLSKTYAEIRELCEYGVSDNYYIYENLITYIKNNKFEADSKNLNTLLKTTVFSNYALMASLETHNKETKPGRGIASTTESKKAPYANEIMARLNVNWAGQYFDFIRASH